MVMSDEKIQTEKQYWGTNWKEWIAEWLHTKTRKCATKTALELKNGVSFPTLEKAFILAKIVGYKVDDLAELVEVEEEE